jgi:hypothetical protein
LEVEIIKALVRVAELSLLVAPFQQPLAATVEFVGNQDGDQVDGCHGLRLNLEQTRFHYRGHAAQA